MIAQHTSTPSGKKSARLSKASPTPIATGHRQKRKLSASERWVLISRKVYTLAQKRGFVGGDLTADLARATREVDKQYETDVQGLLKLSDPGEMVKQFRELFANYGLGQRAIDRLLDLNRDALEKLARANQKLIESRSPYTPRRVVHLQKAAGDAIKMLQDFSRGLTFDEINHQLDAPFDTVKSLLSELGKLASPVSDTAEPATGTARAVARPHIADTEFLRGATVKAYDGMTAGELAEVPVSALRGLTEETGRKLESAFGIHSIREMATCPLVERAAAITVLADAEIEALEKVSGKQRTRRKSAEAMAAADGSLEGFDGVTRRQARLLRDLLRVHSVRDLAENRFVRIAKAIVALADTEDPD